MVEPTLDIPDELANELQAEARRLSVPVSSVLCDALSAYFHFLDLAMGLPRGGR